jgi:hypothetical protein
MLPVRGVRAWSPTWHRAVIQPWISSYPLPPIGRQSAWAAERGSMNGALNAEAPVGEYGWVAPPLAAGRLTGLATQPSFGTKRSMAKSG